MIEPYRQIRNERGLSLIQVIIAITITSMMGLFVMQMVLQMKKVELLMSLQSEVKDVERQIQRVLMDPAACLKTIDPVLGLKEGDFAAGKDIAEIWGPPYLDTTAPPKPLILAGPIVSGVPKGTVYANGQMFLEKITMIRKRPGDPNPLIPFPKSGVIPMFLELKFKKASDSGLGGDYIQRWVPISVHTNNDLAIAECTAVDKIDLAHEICKKLGLTPDPATSECKLLNDPIVVKTACSALGLGSDGVKCQ